MFEMLETVDDVFKALGGTTAVARLTGYKVTAASNWKCLYGYFPARTYTTIINALAKQGKTAPAALWRMEEPLERSA